MNEALAAHADLYRARAGQKSRGLAMLKGFLQF